MSINQELTFDTLLGGIVILNEKNDRPGTIGFLATADGLDRWIVSCYHVLCRTNADPFADGELILQGRSKALSRPVARVSAARARADVDCAAALVNDGIAVSSRILGLPPLSAARSPAKGMRVMKSGATTGVTEGVVSRVSGDEVEIRAPDGAPKGYEVSGFGDSGALWIHADSSAPVAVHFGMRPGITPAALGRPIGLVLAALNVQIAQD
jgi:hypothetical protein